LLFKNFTMTEPRDIIQNGDSSKTKTAYIYRTVNDRTLSEEYNMNSPATKVRIKSMCGTSPSSNYKGNSNSISSPRMTSIGHQVSLDIYNKADACGRDIMAHYGMVSNEHHNKNKLPKN
jgi:hypothetical protein